MSPHETISILDLIDAAAMVVACFAVIYVGQQVFSVRQHYTSPTMAGAARLFLFGTGLSYGVEAVEPWIGDQKWSNAVGHVSVAALWLWVAVFHRERFKRL